MSLPDHLTPEEQRAHEALKQDTLAAEALFSLDELEAHADNWRKSHEHPKTATEEQKADFLLTAQTDYQQFMDTPQDKPRTRGILALSAACAYWKAGLPGRAREAAAGALAAGGIDYQFERQLERVVRMKDDAEDQPHV